MILVRILALGALLLASPAFAEGWRVESVSGDVVSVKGNADPEPLSQGDIVDEGATVVSDKTASVVLGRRGDVLSLSADTIVDVYRGAGVTRAGVEVKAGDAEITSVASPDGPFEVKTRFFRVAAQAADFKVETRKEFATVDVDSGQVQVDDPRHSGGPVTIAAGDSFREDPSKAANAADDAKDPAAKDADAKAKQKAADAEADAIAKKLDEAGMKKGKLTKKQSALAKKLAARAGGAVKEGLDELADDYDADPDTPEVPKIGILRFLFGPEAPSTTIVLTAICVTFLGLGYLGSAALGGVAFGMFGNAAILLVGALLGAGLHDLAFSPAFFWQYEPTPGILTTVIGGSAALIGACFARKYIEDRMDEADTAEPAKPSERRAPVGARRARFGG